MGDDPGGTPQVAVTLKVPSEQPLLGFRSEH